jgi:hypothetical protein
MLLLGGLLLLFLVLFVKSALLLLPWTLTAGVLAGVAGIGLGKQAGRSRASATAVRVGTTLLLTFAFGYLACWLVPPTAPAPKQGVEALLEVPEPRQADLWQMLPVHLGIVSVLSALVVSQRHGWAPDLKPWRTRDAIDADAAPDDGHR